MTNDPKVVFEVHSYDGGFKPELVPDGRRPNYLPETTGPNSTELELAEGDFSFELTMSSRAGRRVTWIGCYTSGVDRQLGARGNYCGVGVWLIDLAPIYVGRLLKLLREGTLEISRNAGITQSIREKFLVLAAELPNLGWFVPFDRLPGQFWKPRFALDRNDSTYLSVPDQDAQSLAVVAADVLRHFVAKPKSGEILTSRHLYLKKVNSKIPLSRLVNLDPSSSLAEEEGLVWNFCEVAQDPISKQNELQRALENATIVYQQEVSGARKEIAELSQKNLQLEAQLKDSDLARAEIENVFNSVSRLIPHFQQATSVTEVAPASSLADLRKLVVGCSDKLDRLNSSIAAFRAANQTVQQPTWQQPPRPEYENAAPLEGLDWLRIGLVVLGGALLVALVWFLVGWFKNATILTF